MQGTLAIGNTTKYNNYYSFASFQLTRAGGAKQKRCSLLYMSAFSLPTQEKLIKSKNCV